MILSSGKENKRGRRAGSRVIVNLLDEPGQLSSLRKAI